MFVSQVAQGRWLSTEDVEVIRCLIAEHPHWSRRRVSVAVSEAFNWRTASGQLKDMSARPLLAKLAERGLIKLPPRQRLGDGIRTGLHLPGAKGISLTPTDVGTLCAFLTGT
jgi:hypothetical protein